MAGKPMWMVRAGEGSQFIAEFLEHSYVAIGWGDAGKLAKGVSKAEIAKRVETTWPQSNKFKVANAAGQINRFLNEISIGDWIVTYDSSGRVYHVGKVVSDPSFVTSETIELRRQRAVAWQVCCGL